MKRYLKQYLWAGLAVLLVAAALFVPQGWFALRDAASLNRTHGEALSPLMVAQLGRSYERNIRERMSAIALQDVICSSKEIDPGNESLWENIGQAENNLLMEALRDNKYVLSAEAQGLEPVIESCTQYVLMGQSDGQILLIANDIYLDKGDGCHMELLLDGVDGTIYYLESEENNSIPRLGNWMDDYNAWSWWWMLNDAYYTEYTQPSKEEFVYGHEEFVYEPNTENVSVSVDKRKVAESEVDADIVVYDAYAFLEDLPPDEGAAQEAGWVNIYSDSYPNIWVSCALNKDIYCCQLPFGAISKSWAMEIEAQDQGAFQYRIRLGLSEVVRAIPEMAKRISLAGIYDIYQRIEQYEKDTTP